MNSLVELAARNQKGNRPVFGPGPFLPIQLMRKEGLKFEQILKHAEGMAAALLNFDLGFETTVVPYDMNGEAEILGCRVHYHEDVEGHTVYPTVGEQWIQTAAGLNVPDDVARAGRMPEIVRAIRLIKEKAGGRGAVGVFIPGPFTLAGQVLDPDRMYVTVLKQPEARASVVDKLTVLIEMVRDAYVAAGADFAVIEEGGATAISPKGSKNLVFPALIRRFERKAVPHILSMTGKCENLIPYMLEAAPDGIGVDQECDLDAVLGALPEGFPLLAITGAYDLLATATPQAVRAAARSGIEKGVRLVSPPADIYPPARLENIEAFVDELRTHRN